MKSYLAMILMVGLAQPVAAEGPKDYSAADPLTIEKLQTLFDDRGYSSFDNWGHMQTALGAIEISTKKEHIVIKEGNLNFVGGISVTLPEVAEIEYDFQKPRDSSTFINSRNEFVKVVDKYFAGPGNVATNIKKVEFSEDENNEGIIGETVNSLVRHWNELNLTVDAFIEDQDASAHWTSIQYHAGEINDLGQQAIEQVDDWQDIQKSINSFLPSEFDKSLEVGNDARRAEAIEQAIPLDYNED